MSPRRRKAEDADVFAALVRVMHRRGPAELTLRAIAREAGVPLKQVQSMAMKSYLNKEYAE